MPRFEITIDPATGKVVKKVIGGHGSACHPDGKILRESCKALGEDVAKDGHLPEFYEQPKAKTGLREGGA